MLTKEENESLTRVGPGTPAGEMLRRYWHPIAFVQELKNPADPETNFGRRFGALSRRAKSAGITGVAVLASRNLAGIRPPGGWRFALLLSRMAL